MIKSYVLLVFVFASLIISAQNRYVDSLKAALTHTTKLVNRFDLINKIAEDYWTSGNGNTVDSSYPMQMLRIAQKLKSDSLKAISDDWIGNYYFMGDVDYAKALEYFLKGVPLAEKVHDKRRLSSIYFDISNLYWGMQNPAEVLNYAKKGQSALPDKSNPMYNFMLTQYFNAMGSYYELIEQPDSQLHYLLALNEITFTTKNRFFEVQAQDGLGNFYSQLGDTALAETYLKKAIQVADLNRNFYYQSVCKYDFAVFLLKQNRLDEAKRLAMQSFIISEQNNYKDNSQFASGLLKNIYVKLNNTDSAFYYSQIESAMKDSIFNQQKMNRIQAMAFTEQIRISDEESKKAEDAEQQRQNIQYVLIALGIVILIILYLLLSRSFITNEKIIEFFGVVALLIVFEFFNLLLHPLLDRITNHTPFLMLLGLVCVAALLVPVHHKLEKWATRKLIEKNKQIRLATAKKVIERLEKSNTAK